MSSVCSRHRHREYFSATTLRYYDAELERDFCQAFDSNFATFDARASLLNLLFPLVRLPSSALCIHAPTNQQMVTWKECQHVMPTGLCSVLGAPTGAQAVTFSHRMAVHCAVLTSIALNATHWVSASLFPNVFRRHRTTLLTIFRLAQHVLLPATFLLYPAQNVTCGFLRGCHLHNLVRLWLNAHLSWLHAHLSWLHAHLSWLHAHLLWLHAHSSMHHLAAGGGPLSTSRLPSPLCNPFAHRTNQLHHGDAVDELVAGHLCLAVQCCATGIVLATGSPV